jgi:hypothetical protein
MNIEVDWLTSDDSVLETKEFDPHSQEWSEFEALSLRAIIQMGGESCTHISMALVE